jgi:hypothetical protein
MSEREPPKLPELPAIPGDDKVDRVEIWALMRSYGTACFEAGFKAGRESIFGKPDAKGEAGGR